MIALIFHPIEVKVSGLPQLLTRIVAVQQIDDDLLRFFHVATHGDATHFVQSLT